MAKSKRRAAKPMKQGAGLTPILLAGAAAIIIVAGLIIYNQNASRIVIATDVQIDYPVGITEDGQPFKGSAEAKVVIEEFADFACSHCGEFYRSVKEINEDYIKTGQVQFVFKNYPIIGASSISAARGGECALQQSPEAFWAMHDVLFENQDLGVSVLSNSSLRDIAEQLPQIDSSTFSSCLSSSNEAAKAVNDDMAEGDSRGVTGTPALFINGEKSGALSASGLRGVIDPLINE